MTALRAVRLLALALVLAGPRAQAGQPLVTDDAAIVAPQTCQLETWISSTREGHEYWAQPACNFTGNLEITVGFAHRRPDAGRPSIVVQPQAKAVLFTDRDGAWSLGAAMGGARDSGVPLGNSPMQAYYAKALFSWYPHSDLEIDLNLGAAHVYGSGSFALAGATANMRSSRISNFWPKYCAMSPGAADTKLACEAG